MQPVLSCALRMLMGHDHFDEDALARMATEIRDDPAVMEVFPDSDAEELPFESPLLSQADTEALLAALDGTGIEVTAESNNRHRIGNAPLRIVTDPAGVEDHVDAACIDGLDPRQWALLRQLQRPGERSPFVVAGAEQDGFRVLLCAWLDAGRAMVPSSFADLKARVVAWDGTEPDAGLWHTVRGDLEEQARSLVNLQAARAADIRKCAANDQVNAARLRLTEELGRLLVCFSPDTDDLNGKFHRLGQEATPTATRLRRVFQRLGSYPNWSDRHLSEIRAAHADLRPTQITSRRTGRELDAALDDPRWPITG